MLEYFLADELTLAVAVGGEPNPPGGAQRLANNYIGGFVAVFGRAGAGPPFRREGHLSARYRSCGTASPNIDGDTDAQRKLVAMI